MTDPNKVIHMTNQFDAIHLDTSSAPAELLLEAYKQTVAKLMEACTERNYLPVEDLRITIDVAVVVEPQGVKSE